MSKYQAEYYKKNKERILRKQRERRQFIKRTYRKWWTSYQDKYAEMFELLDNEGPTERVQEMLVNMPIVTDEWKMHLRAALEQNGMAPCRDTLVSRSNANGEDLNGVSDEIQDLWGQLIDAVLENSEKIEKYAEFLAK